MPEPGINDPDFSRPATKSVRGPVGGQLTRKRLRAPIKIPGEYAKFQLNDGRVLSDVLGEEFFLPESRSDGDEPLPAYPLDQMPKGNPPFGGAFEGNPRFSRGPAAGSSVSGQRPGGGRIENPGRRLEDAEKPEFTSADILNPRDRRELESLDITMQGAVRKIAQHEDRLDLYERRFKNKWIDARAMGQARRYFEFRIGQQEALIARNENRLTEIRAAALLDAAALSPGDAPRAEDAREDGAPVFPTARPRPANVESGMPGGAEEARDDEGFWTLGLPLTAEGQVNESALRPGAVYRVPDSAGGGTGQWKSGMFYNFDQKGDWRLRTVGDLDAYAGASDAPTPEERDEQAMDDLDKAFMPAADMNDDDIGKFKKETGYGLTRGEGGFTLTDPSGRELFDLANEDAAELARIWSPEIASQIATMGLPWREDLTPEEKRKLLAEAIGADKLGPARKYITGRGRAANASRDAKRHLIQLRMKAYDDLAAAMERGASGEEIGELLGEFHAAMLPEVLGTERFVREFLMDLVPGLGNVRSFRHLQNDIAEIDRAIETGEWDDAAWASGMAVLDFIGIFPGGNVLKGLARGAVDLVPYARRALAERSIRRLARQWNDPDIEKVNARMFFGDVFDEFSLEMQEKLRGLLNDRIGKGGGEKILEGLGKQMDPSAGRGVPVKLPSGQGFLSMTREYDLEARYWSDIVASKNATLGRLARWLVNAGDEAASGAKAEVKKFELKVGERGKPPREDLPDTYFRENPDVARKNGVNEIVDLRMDPKEIPIVFVMDDLSGHLNKWVKQGRLSRSDADVLQQAMKQMMSKGTSNMSLKDYTGLLARLAAAPARSADIEPENEPAPIPDNIP